MRALKEIVEDLELGKQENALVDGWTEFLLRYEFEWFCTFTFRDVVGPEFADRSYQHWIKSLNRYLYGPAAHRRGASCYWVRALELQKRGVIHFHALIGDANPIANRISFSTSPSDKSGIWYWEELWFEHAGIARIDLIRIHEFASRYVSKYVGKGGEVDMSANLAAFVPPHSGLLD